MHMMGAIDLFSSMRLDAVITVMPRTAKRGKVPVLAIQRAISRKPETEG